MADYRPKIPNEIKKKLIEEAGNKCANPGCDNHRVHLHHIEEWHIYKMHNEEHMIAVCPSCHDEIHYGTNLSDETLYSWKKNIKVRKNNQHQNYIFIERQEKPKILLGKLAVTSNSESEFFIFKLSKGNNLKFSIKRQDILIFDLKIQNLVGKEIIAVSNNHVEYHSELVKIKNNRKNRKRSNSPISYETRKGKISLKVPVSEEFIPTWALTRFRQYYRDFHQEYPKDNRLTLLEIEVLAPGLVKIEGVWTEDNYAVIVTEKLLVFDSIERLKNNLPPMGFTNDGVFINDVFNYTTLQIASNTIDLDVLFKFEKN